MKLLKGIVSAALLAMPLGAAVAADKGKEPKDPNRMVCREIPVTGSRVQRVRQCQTNAEWEAIKAIDRRDLERIQAERPRTDRG